MAQCETCQGTDLPQGWKKKFKGSPERGGAWVYVHPDSPRAIVRNHRGIFFDGEPYESLGKAAAAALAAARKEGE